VIAIISTYPPRQCGIATFAAHLRQGLLAAGAASVPVVALLRGEEDRAVGPAVIGGIHQDLQASYALASQMINRLAPRAVLLQHEFGIFGGEDGRYVLDLADALRLPIITTLHTVPERPTPSQRLILHRLGDRSARVVVLAPRAQRMLSETYGVDPAKIVYIPHGVPTPPPGSALEWKRRLGLENRTVVMTFGLLSPGKGIEVAIEAMAQAVSRHPELLYLIVGTTHPEVRRRYGEAYREFLAAKIDALGLHDHVRFVNRYLTDREVLGYLRACDIYVTPYPNRDQISSGTLTYAAFMGKAIISTPYIYAEELLGDGAALFFPFGDSAALAECLIALAGDRMLRDRLSLAARRRTSHYAWDAVGGAYLKLMPRRAFTPAFEAVPVDRPAWA